MAEIRTTKKTPFSISSPGHLCPAMNFQIKLKRTFHMGIDIRAHEKNLDKFWGRTYNPAKI